MGFRIGVFFVLLGGMSMWVYFATDFADAPIYWLFFASLGLLILGIILIRRNYSPPPPSDRFRLLRRRKREEREDR
jgi:hypothetical protein